MKHASRMDRDVTSDREDEQVSSKGSPMSRIPRFPTFPRSLRIERFVSLWLALFVWVVSPGAAKAANQPPTAGVGLTADTRRDDIARDGVLRVAQDEVKEPKRAPKVPPGTKVKVDWAEMDLQQLTRRMVEMTGRSVIMGESLEGKKVTIYAPTQVTIENAWQIYLSALRTAGYTLVPSGGGTLKVVKREEAAAEPIDTVTGNDTRDGQTYITRLIRLDNIPVDDITKVLQKLVASEGSMVSYQPNNTLIITDTEVNINRLMGIIAILDVEAPKEVLEVVEIKFAEANAVAEIIRQVYGDESAGRGTARTGSTTASRRSRRPTEGGGASTTDVEGQSSISKIIPDERTNSLIILATEKALEDIRQLVAQLDYEVDPLLKSDIHVVFLEHAKAEEMATTLSNLASDAGRGGATARRPTTSGTRTAATAARPAAASADGTVATFEGGVKVTADEATNALVITASYNDFIILKRVIDKLDVRRRQVFVEGVILEISQDRSSDLGISYHGGAPLGTDSGDGFLFGARGSQSILPPLTDTTSLAGMALGVFGASIPISIPTAAGAVDFDLPAFGVFLQALQSDQEVNILSTPQIMTLNNKEAEIVVGENVPFLSGSTITGTGLQTVNITREDVALKLKVKPQVNEGNEVTLEINQEITEVVASTAGDQKGPTTTKRTATTTVSVPDNQTVVIGGLISSKLSTAESKVPILGDIPLIGVLFRRTSKTERKSNLLIFLTPHVIDSPEDLQDVYRIKMLQRQEFIRRFYGKSREEQLQEMSSLLQYSMNLPGYESAYPTRLPRDLGPDTISDGVGDEMGRGYGGYGGSFSGDGGEGVEEPAGEEPGQEEPLPEDMEPAPEDAPVPDEGGEPVDPPVNPEEEDLEPGDGGGQLDGPEDSAPSYGEEPLPELGVTESWP